MADLLVQSVDLRAAAAGLAAAAAEADELPGSVDHARIELDLRGGPVAAAAAGLLERWYIGLDELSDATGSVVAWLDAFADELDRVEQRLASRPGR